MLSTANQSSLLTPMSLICQKYCQGLKHLTCHQVERLHFSTTYIATLTRALCLNGDHKRDREEEWTMRVYLTNDHLPVMKRRMREAVPNLGLLRVWKLSLAVLGSIRTAGCGRH